MDHPVIVGFSDEIPHGKDAFKIASWWMEERMSYSRRVCWLELILNAVSWERTHRTDHAREKRNAK